jgi:hypothetical protein
VIKIEKLQGKQYKFKHIQIAVLEKNEDDNVMVFSACFSTVKLPGQIISDGHMEINKTLWNQASVKRPKGYWLLGSSENAGIMTSYFVSDEWLEITPSEIKDSKRKEWGVSQ